MAIFNDEEGLRSLNIASLSAAPGVSPVNDSPPSLMAGFTQEPAVADIPQDVDYRDKVVTGFAPAADYVGEFDYPLRFAKTDTASYVHVKRLFDIVFALLAMLVSSPLMILIAVAIKVSSRGPVLFLQERIGLHGSRFKMLKFRSMYLNDRCDTHHTSVGDPRITPVGAFLRKTSLDELPQFFNVLKGEMSVVGPRPELTKFVEKFAEEIPEYMTRHLGKGGITGWAQIHGFRGSETSIATRVEYDIEYLRNWSFWLDLKIILITIRRGLTHNAF